MRQADLAAVLAACIAPQPGIGGPAERQRLGLLGPTDWRDLLELADAQGVSSLLCWRLKARGLDSAVAADVLAALERRVRKTGMRNLAMYASLKRILSLLQAAGIPAIVLKGAFLAAAVYRDISMRQMIDVDLLVPVDRLAEAGGILESDGYRSLRPYTVEALPTALHHLPRLVKPGEPPYEIHWNLLHPARPWSVEIDGFWERSVPVRLAGVATQALSPDDQLLYLCAHAAYGHQFTQGLRASCDLAETIRRHGGELAWGVLVERARRLRWQRGVYAALVLARDLVGAAVPREALDGLQPEGVDAAVLRDAGEQMLIGGSAYRAVRPSMSRLRPARGSDERAPSLFAQLLSRESVARRYLLRPGSARVFLYYPRRVLDLLTRHGLTALRLWRREPETTRLLRRRARLDDWLAGSGG